MLAGRDQSDVKDVESHPLPSFLTGRRTMIATVSLNLNGPPWPRGATMFTSAQTQHGRGEERGEGEDEG